MIDKARRGNGSVDAKKLANAILKKHKIRYHVSQIRRRAKVLGFVYKCVKRVFVNAASASTCRNWPHQIKHLTGTLEYNGYTVCVQDESIIKYDSLQGKKLMIERGSDYYVQSTRSHKKVAVFGLLTADGRQIFSCYDSFNAESFVKFLEAARQKFGKIVMIVDRAAQHQRQRPCTNTSPNRKDVRLLFPQKLAVSKRSRGMLASGKEGACGIRILRDI